MTYLTAILISTATAAPHSQPPSKFIQWWRGFCERHLIADDPYQYESLTLEQLMGQYHGGNRSSVLIAELSKRLLEEDREYEDTND